jgi:exodeoxyribonuclease-3
MRLTTWNCCWKFEQKLLLLSSERPDIAVIQECSKASLQNLPTGYRSQWLHGASNHGLGMIYHEFYTISKVKVSDLPSFASIDIDGPIRLRLIAAWNCPPKSTTYIAHLHEFLDAHQDWFDHEAVVLAGDLNSQSGASFDRGTRRHADFADRLSGKNIHDSYGVLHNPGKPDTLRQPTYRHRRSLSEVFHLDYIFASEMLLRNVMSVDIGSPSVWAALNDHSPVTLTLTMAIKGGGEIFERERPDVQTMPIE